MMLAAHGATDQKAGPGRSFGTKVKKQICYDQGAGSPMKNDVFLHAGDPFHCRKQKFVTPVGGRGDERLSRKADHFAESLGRQEGDFGKGLATLLAKSVVSKHDLQQPTRLALG